MLGCTLVNLMFTSLNIYFGLTNQKLNFLVKIRIPMFSILKVLHSTLFKEKASILPTEKHCDGSIMMRGCFEATGIGQLAIVENLMNFDKYQDILNKKM